MTDKRFRELLRSHEITRAEQIPWRRVENRLRKRLARGFARPGEKNRNGKPN